LRVRVERLGLTYTAAAPLLGLTLDGLRKQMGGDRPVSRQTEIILDQIEELREKTMTEEISHFRRSTGTADSRASFTEGNLQMTLRYFNPTDSAGNYLHRTDGDLAQQLCSMLIADLREREYVELSREIYGRNNVTGLSARYGTACLAWWCLEHRDAPATSPHSTAGIPMLTSLIVGQDGEPGPGYLLPVADFANEQRRTIRFGRRWHQIVLPTAAEFHAIRIRHEHA